MNSISSQNNYFNTIYAAPHMAPAAKPETAAPLQPSTPELSDGFHSSQGYDAGIVMPKVSLVSARQGAVPPVVVKDDGLSHARDASGLSLTQAASFLPSVAAVALSSAASQTPDAKYNEAVKSEPAITSMMQSLAEDQGFELVGLEHRLKSWESFSRKIAANPEGYEVKDIIRYTVVESPDKLTQTTLKTMEDLEKAGYKTIVVKNTWDNEANPYKGINTFVESPEGQKFELQYHTRDSFDLKDGEMHKLYEQWRLIPDPESPEAIALNDRMLQLADSLPRPENISSVENRK